MESGMRARTPSCGRDPTQGSVAQLLLPRTLARSAVGVAAPPGIIARPHIALCYYSPCTLPHRSTMMVNPLAQAHRGLGTTLFSLLNPIPFGFFVGALIFDAIYLNSAEVMWGKAAAWLITFGLLMPILPRLINLFAGCRPHVPLRAG